MKRMTSAVRAAAVAGRQVAVLQRAGIIDVRHPLRMARTAKAVRELGPIAGGVRSAARTTPDRVALVDAAGAIGYGELDRWTDAIAAHWLARGISTDSVVAALGRDDRDLVATMIAVAKIGARLVLMNTGFSGAQLAEVAEREAVTAVVGSGEFADVMAALPDSVTSLDLAAPPAGDETVTAPPVPARAGEFVLLTGGTTGTPKGAPRTVRSPLAAAQFLDRVPWRRGATMLLCAPLFHGTALSQFILALNLGCTIVLHGRFDARRAVEQIERHRCDGVVLVPTMLRRILDLGPGELARFDTGSVRVIFTAGAALAPALGNQAIAAFGPVIYNFYGCTETGTATIATPEDWLAAPGTVGKPPVGIRVALYDEHGTRIEGPGRVGTVYVGNAIAFAGYSGGGSKKTIDGLMSTGDLGHFDSEGRLFIDGRDDDMIVSGGENVFPGEIEDLLYAHPAIGEAAVIGVEDAEFGQRLAAFIVRAGELDEAGVRAYVKANSARFKVPRDVVFVDEIPRTTTGKTDRRALAGIDRAQPPAATDA
ncbi:AMP-binding protein [Nocardia cyriacigeorgica]|uniref:AMP-binding protein n=2 Tax=Nocardia cyriacigeorgica TaxID=135487 RepID=UPI001894DC59|nr:AMP-binding protein [Nocardia cyriacigeorgica]MBF6455136.1 AMP-binding protein [Nocardia cyriacigeorgica]MBF6481396.1 AMP-binding protein [Nocardia cyriacigeorgica]MBF6554122.1 AMP-binding protein [Nocardia cyriacigeorgica]